MQGKVPPTVYPDAPRATRPRIGSIADLVERQMGRYGDKPFLTWYDDDRGERVELSFRTFENWTAKVANLLVEEVGAGPGDRVATVLGGHWRGAAIALACWRAGACLVPVDVDAPAGAVAARLRATGCEVAFVGEWRLGEVAERLGQQPGRPALVAVAAGLLARPGASASRTPGDPPSRTAGDGASHAPGDGASRAAGETRALDFSLVVPGMGDMFDGDRTSVGDDALLPGDGWDGVPLTQGDLLAWGAGTAAGLGLGDTDRVLAGLPAHQALGTVTGLVAPFLAGAGVVVEQAFRPAAFWKRVADERVAVAVLGVDQAEALLDDQAGAASGLDLGRLRAVACDLDRLPGPLASAWERRFGVPLCPAPARTGAGRP
jgi:acyl-CoA synthetase (AMP-forming)/AMP-acid ligase II